jgi:hypothetical protein
MKTRLNIIFFVFAMFFAFFQSMAQSPNAFNYQAVARDASGNILANHTLSIKISLHKDSETGDVDYSETFNVTTNDFGLFTLAIGQGIVVSGSFSSIDWKSYKYWLQVEMDPAGGSSYADMGTSQLLSVPYAMYAKSSVWKENANDAYITGKSVGIGTMSPAAVLHVNRNNDLTNGQIYVSQDGSGDASIGFKAGTVTWAIANDQSENNRFVIGNSYDASLNPKMIITTTGNTGFGTTNPTKLSRLHVASNTRYAGYFTTDSSSLSSYAIKCEFLGSGADGRGVVGISEPGDFLGVGGQFSANYIGLHASSSGTGNNSYYGVCASASTTGTSGTVYGVYGYTSGSSTTRYGVYCSGNGAYTGTWSSVSDIKFKKDIENYGSALNNIMKLRPVSYTMKTEEYPFMNFATGTQIGFIAQEVKEIFPTLVEQGKHPGEKKEDPQVEYLGMNYIGMVPILVAGMQEQQQQIELLKQQIEQLKQEINALKK